jgi:hypothetical protein
MRSIEGLGAKNNPTINSRLIALALMFIPEKKKAPKKVTKKKVAVRAKVSDDKTKHLERIEKRLEELHEKVEHLNDRHREVLGLFEDHMVKHHKKEVSPLPPPPKPSLRPPVPPSNVKYTRPGPHPEALHPEGPPENMSLGDDHGELGRKTGPEPLKTAPPRRETTKCSKCGSEVGTDLVKCPTCGAKL